MWDEKIFLIRIAIFNRDITLFKRANSGVVDFKADKFWDSFNI